MLDPEEATRLRRGAKVAARVEQKAKRAFQDVFAVLEEKMLHALMNGLPPPDFDPTAILLQNAFDAMSAAFTTTPKLPAPDDRKRLAKGLPMKIPSNPRELRVWWDLTRHGKAPARIQAQADAIRKAYLAKTQSIWQRVSQIFRQGGSWNQDDARAAVRPIFAVPQQRANTIVATETTRYYNQVRRVVYDQVPAVTHYLYIAIRDHRTTEWCKTRQGLVYKAGSVELERNTPPVHWNCRSEITPLLPTNPKHKALIDDPKRDPKKAVPKPKPLPKDWNK